MKAKKRRVGLIEGNPFCLPGHLILRTAHATGPLSVLQPVGQTATGEHVVRFDQEPPTQTANATPPPTEAATFSASDDILRLAQSDDVSHLAQIAETALARLAHLARHSNGRALWAYGQVTNRAGEGLSELTSANPAAWVPFAKHCARWPMMRSTHPLNCDPDSWLESISLGTAHGLCLDKYSKWKPGYAATVAIRLIEHLQAIGAQNPEVAFSDGSRRFAEWLPELNRETAPQWWDLALQFLERTYPKLETVPELAGLVTARTKTKSLGRRRQAIKDLLRRRFFA